MEIGRRELLTGLAAVAVAGVTSGLPVRAAALDRRSVVLGSIWHYHEAEANQITIRHVPTGLTFQRRPTEADQYALALVGAPPPMDATTIAIIGRAARFVSLHACMIWSCRPKHKGAIFFRYRPDADPDDPYYDPLTEDAPPLPRVPLVRAGAAPVVHRMRLNEDEAGNHWQFFNEPSEAVLRDGVEKN
jgi:hypothetical protein